MLAENTAVTITAWRSVYRGDTGVVIGVADDGYDGRYLVRFPDYGDLWFYHEELERVEES